MMLSHTSVAWMKPINTLALLSLAALVSVLPAHAQRARFAPEAASGFSQKPLATAKEFMVSAANPLAVEAGVEILREGGTAVDAAIAVQLVLNLVEPQSSGIGGGAFLLHWNEAAQKLTTYDGRERAPMAAEPERFIRDGKFIPFGVAVHSGLSIGVPGLMKLLGHAHKKHGKLQWKRLFEPAIKLATDGFDVSPRLNVLLRLMGASAFDEASRRYFFNAAGEARPVGERLSNIAFAATLRAIADGGADAFYSGPIARAIVDAAKDAPNYAGDVTLDDLAAYDVVERPPVCITYRGYRICGMGPPSSGALTIAQTLKMIEPFDVGSGPGEAMQPSALHLIAEAQKLAFADRGRFMADPDFVTVPAGLLDSGYISSRRDLISRRRAARNVRPGNPPGAKKQAFGRDATIESVGTSHFSIIDRDGNVVSMTTTIESAFGSRVWAAGFLLNNELTDFSFLPRDGDGRAIANAVAPGKRPRSSMAPTIVFDPEGKFYAAVGSPGGSSIILYVTKAIVGLIDWKLDAQAATELLNFGSRGHGFQLELNPAITSGLYARLWRAQPSIWHALRLRGFGHQVRPDWMTSGLHIVVSRNGRLFGGADPRREGIAVGD